MRRLPIAISAFAVSISGGIALSAGSGFEDPVARSGHPQGDAVRSRPALASGCFALSPNGSDRFDLKPTGLRKYMLQDQEGRLLAVDAAGDLVRADDPGASTEWLIRRGPDRGFTVSLPNGPVDVISARGCRRFPEARTGARGQAFRGTLADGSVLGFADAHMHITANLRAGGRVIHGEPFHRFGISEALGHDEDDHGPDGSLDVTGNLLRDGSPVGTHDTHGWPSFAGWPVHDTITHQQGYYIWLKRAWKAGLRVLVAQAVEDEALCTLEPLRSHSCDETETVKLAIAQLRGLERYIDAQSGGRRRGWLRLVENPRQARQVIERGKLAVVIGMETSSPFGCSEFLYEPQCTREDIDRVLGELHRLGVRSVFLAHWVDNAFGGAALQSGAQGDFISVFENLTTGHPFATEPCGDADEADGTCNATGLTEIGRYIVRRMIDLHMLIEADHLSQNARKAVFKIVERHSYPLVSSHTGTGGEWTADQLQRLGELGGIAAATPEVAPDLVTKILKLRRRLGGPVTLGSDTGGFASLPGPREDGPKLAYPFTSYDGAVQFRRQRTGERVFDLNDDGVAHYGLFADLIADMQQQEGGERALRALFGSAEAYLRMWEQAYEAR